MMTRTSRAFCLPELYSAGDYAYTISPHTDIFPGSASEKNWSSSASAGIGAVARPTASVAKILKKRQ
jgi:hypothetical protein